MLACHEHPLEIPVHDVFPSRHVQIGCTFITLGQPDIVVRNINTRIRQSQISDVLQSMCVFVVSLVGYCSNVSCALE